MMAAVNHLRQQVGPVALEVRHYGTRESTYELYDDDGETFDYEKGVFSLRQLRAGARSRGAQGSRRTASRRLEVPLRHDRLEVHVELIGHLRIDQPEE